MGRTQVKQFQIIVEAVNSTSDGTMTIGGFGDDHDCYVFGMKHYFVDDLEVSFEEFEAAVAAEGVAHFKKEDQ